MHALPAQKRGLQILTEVFELTKVHTHTHTHECDSCFGPFFPPLVNALDFARRHAHGQIDGGLACMGLYKASMSDHCFAPSK